MSTKIIWIRRFWEDYKPREKPSRKQFPRDIEKQVILLERSRIYPGTILEDGRRLYTKQNDQKKAKRSV